MQNSINLLREKKTCCKRSRRTWWVGHLFCSLVKHSLAKLSIENQPIFADQRLRLMLIKCLRTLCTPSCCAKHKKHYDSLFFLRDSDVLESCLRSKTYFCYDNSCNKLKFSSKGLNKEISEQNSDGPLQKYKSMARFLMDNQNFIDKQRFQDKGSHRCIIWTDWAKILIIILNGLRTTEFKQNHRICKFTILSLLFGVVSVATNTPKRTFSSIHLMFCFNRIEIIHAKNFVLNLFKVFSPKISMELCRLYDVTDDFYTFWKTFLSIDSFFSNTTKIKHPNNVLYFSSAIRFQKKQGKCTK